MQPNKYQKIVLNDLRSFLLRWVDCNDPAEAFRAHWEEKGVSRMPNYQRQSHGVAQVCAKVPTAGGKTLIGIYSLQEAFNVMSKRSGEPRLCVWLVPSLSIKDQVIKRFSTAGDGYWLALREALGNKVTVLSKEQLLAGEGQFNGYVSIASWSAKQKQTPCQEHDDGYPILSTSACSALFSQPQTTRLASSRLASFSSA